MFGSSSFPLNLVGSYGLVLWLAGAKGIPTLLWQSSNPFFSGIKLQFWHTQYICIPGFLHCGLAVQRVSWSCAHVYLDFVHDLFLGEGMKLNWSTKCSAIVFAATCKRLNNVPHHWILEPLLFNLPGDDGTYSEYSPALGPWLFWTTIQTRWSTVCSLKKEKDGTQEPKRNSI